MSRTFNVSTPTHPTPLTLRRHVYTRKSHTFDATTSPTTLPTDPPHPTPPHLTAGTGMEGEECLE